LDHIVMQIIKTNREKGYRNVKKRYLRPDLFPSINNNIEKMKINY